MAGRLHRNSALNYCESSFGGVLRRNFLVGVVCADRERFRIKTDPNPGKKTEARPLKSGRIFISPIEQVVGPCEKRHAFADVVLSGNVYNKIRISVQPRDGEGAISVDLRTDVKQRG